MEDKKDLKVFKFYFDCRYKFGSTLVDGHDEKEAEKLAIKKIQHSSWCENRCDKCKLKLSIK
jgi:hypothetical protein